MGEQGVSYQRLAGVIRRGCRQMSRAKPEGRRLPGWEVEVKVPGRVDEALLRRLGARFLGEERHRDTYFNALHCDFAATDQALRIRETPSGCYLTYKGPKQKGDMKKRLEIEVGVEQTADGAKDLLAALGYRPVATVSKTRRTWELEGVLVCLDRVDDVGDFVELELESGGIGGTRQEGNGLTGTERRLWALLVRLGLDVSKATTASYLEMLLDSARRKAGSQASLEVSLGCFEPEDGRRPLAHLDGIRHDDERFFPGPAHGLAERDSPELLDVPQRAFRRIFQDAYSDRGNAIRQQHLAPPMIRSHHGRGRSAGAGQPVREDYTSPAAVDEAAFRCRRKRVKKIVDEPSAHPKRQLPLLRPGLRVPSALLVWEREKSGGEPAGSPPSSPLRQPEEDVGAEPPYPCRFDISRPRWG